MDYRAYVGAVSSIVLTLLCGCSVGGFQGSENTKGTAPNAPTYMVEGVASKGIIRGGKVSFFALNNNGSVGARVKSAGTNVFGIYSASISLAGPILLTATGTYTDESTGLDAEIPAEAPLRAAVVSVANAQGSLVAITPLTELAVLKSMPLLMSDTIAAANQLVSDIFKINIISTQPLVPTATQFDDETIPQAQKDYTLVLAALSQMAHDYYHGTVSALVAALHDDLTQGGALGDLTRTQFRSALSVFLQSEQNKTGVREITATNLINAGGGTRVVKLALTGELPAGTSISGVTVTMTLPTGVTVRVSNFTDYQSDADCVKASGNFQGATTVGRFVPATGTQAAALTVSVGQAARSSLGEFLTVVCDTPAGFSFNAADFQMSQVKAVDDSGAELPGVTVEVL